MADDRWKNWTPWRLKRAQAAEAATADQQTCQHEAAGYESTTAKELIDGDNSSKNAGDSNARTRVAKGKRKQ
jgi:hypothetical protein